MKVLITTDTIGGVWNYSLTLVHKLAQNNISVVLATLGRKLSPDQSNDLLTVPRLEVHEGPYKLCWMQDPWEDVEQSGRWLLQIARNTKPDIAHLSEYPHAALDWKVPVVLVAHSCVFSWFEAVKGESPGDDWMPYHDEVTWGLVRANLVVTPTQSMLDALRQHYVFETESVVIFNGSEHSDFWSAPKERFALAVGRAWDEAKNLQFLADVADQCGQPLLIVGDCSKPGQSRRSMHLPFVGRQTHTELRRLYSRAAVYAHPATYEPFGLSILEAAMSGCALLLSDIPTLREVWRDAAVFCNPRDADDWKQNLVRLNSNTDLRQEMALRSQLRARELNAQAMFQNYLFHYEKLIASTSMTTVVP